MLFGQFSLLDKQFLYKTFIRLLKTWSIADGVNYAFEKRTITHFRIIPHCLSAFHPTELH